jgi:hypothetical protein
MRFRRILPRSAGISRRSMMSRIRRRIETLQVLVDGSSLALTYVAECSLVSTEFQSVSDVHSTPQVHRRWLLQVLHSTRAIDTYLYAFVRCFGYMPPQTPPAHLRAYLQALRGSPTSGRGSLNSQQYARFKADIVYPRNRYMHEAGAYPMNDQEVLSLLAAMYDLVSTVDGL